MYTGVSEGEDTTALCIHTKCLSHYLLLCVYVYVHTWVQVNTRFTTSRVKTCNSDHFTRMQPQIYGCVCLSAWVWVCLEERCYAWLGTSASPNRRLGNGKGAYYDPGPEFWICVGLQQPTSGLCLSVVFQPVIRQAGVIPLSIPVQRRPWAEETMGNMGRIMRFLAYSLLDLVYKTYFRC